MSKTANITEYLNSRKVELQSQVIELGIIDQIAAMKKENEKFVADAWKADATIKAAVEKINAAYKFWAMNTKMPANKRKILDGLTGQLDKQAKDLGIDPKSLPAFKDSQDVYQALSELDDAISNMQEHLKTIGK